MKRKQLFVDFPLELFDGLQVLAIAEAKNLV